MKTKICKECLTDKPLSDFGPHSTTQDGYNPKCKKCISDYNREYRKKNKKKIQETSKQYAITNGEVARARTKQWMVDNAKKKKEMNKRYYQENREQQLANSRDKYENDADSYKQRSKDWRNHNKGRVNAQCAKRRADKKQATPTWANKELIDVLYDKARMLTENSDEPYQVDHIVPLNSDIVCGLHWEGNLQIITAEENNSKNNKLLEELL